MKMPRALLTYPWLPAVGFVALFVALVWFGVWRWRKQTEREIAATLRVKQQQHVIDSLARVTASHDTIYRVDTITARRLPRSLPRRGGFADSHRIPSPCARR